MDRLRRASAGLPAAGLLLFAWPKGRSREAGWIDRASCPDDPLAGIHAGHPAG